ncbi:pyridoxamine 5'-phosphate oxidase family protein [Candidatus Gottesmanbacteria bacterium]|nr:pyridoxamine 5'-phosphate oxidase family protein [Candidatus Gottesmanbacteria bacterium]
MPIPLNILEYLKNKKQKFCTLATATADGRPHASMLKYAIMEDGTLILATHKNTKKWYDLTENGHVALVIGTSFEELNVQIHGNATIADENGKKQIEAYTATHPYLGEIKDNPDVVFIIIQPTWIRTTDFSKQPPEKTEATIPV